MVVLPYHHQDSGGAAAAASTPHDAVLGVI